LRKGADELIWQKDMSTGGDEKEKKKREGKCRWPGKKKLNLKKRSDGGKNHISDENNYGSARETQTRRWNRLKLFHWGKTGEIINQK